jgi:hypothetical protein
MPCVIKDPSEVFRFSFWLLLLQVTCLQGLRYSVDVTNTIAKVFTTLSNATSSKWHHLTNAPELNVLVFAMTILVARVARTRWRLQDVCFCARSIVMSSTSRTFSCGRCMRMAEKEKKPDGDPRINILGRAIEDDFATIRENYGIVLGLFPTSDIANAYSYS